MNEEVKNTLDKILDPKEQAELEMFIERPVLVEAVRKVLFWRMNEMGVVRPGVPSQPNFNSLLSLVSSQYAKDGMINNESLGQDLRARWEGIKALQVAFSEMELYKKKVVEVKEEKNKAR